MSLSVFSFDTEAFIESWSKFFEQSEPLAFDEEENSSVEPTAANDAADRLLADLFAAAEQPPTVTSETKETVEIFEKIAVQIAAPAVAAKILTPNLSAEARKSLEEFVRELRASLTHSYQSLDLSEDKTSFNVARNSLQNSGVRKSQEKDESKDNRIEERKRDLKHEALRDELRRALANSVRRNAV